MIAGAFVSALALAGCGGGGGTPADTSRENGDGFTNAILPEEASGITYNTNNQPIEMLAPGADAVPTGSNVTVRCSSSATGPCRWRVTKSNGIEVMGRATVVLTSSIRVLVDGRAEQPLDNDPLSVATLAEALEGMGSERTIWSAADASLAASTSTPHKRTTLAGETLTLTLNKIGSEDVLHWGHWHRFVRAAGGKRTGELRGTFFGGATPYETKPEPTLDKATYGKDGAVNFYVRNGKDGKWTPGTANLSLEANFRAGKIGGKISGVDYDGGGTAPAANIALSETDISGSGTFTGDAELEGLAFSGKSGAWGGEFYGDTTETVNDVEKPKVPSHVAGEFSVAGRHGTGSSMKELHVNGAFGAAIVK